LDLLSSVSDYSFIWSAEKKLKVFSGIFLFFVGESFVLLAVFMSIYSIVQHRRVLRTLRPVEIPEGYNLWSGVVVNVLIGGLGLALSVYMARGFM
jgi:hypothetical protein